MRRLLIALAFALALGAAVDGAWYDFEQITVDNTAGGVKLTVAKVAISVQTARCRVRTAEISVLAVDPTKTAVTASVGTLLEPGDLWVSTSREEMLNLRAIRTGATSGQLDCEYKYTAAP